MSEHPEADALRGYARHLQRAAQSQRRLALGLDDEAARLFGDADRIDAAAAEQSKAGD